MARNKVKEGKQMAGVFDLNVGKIFDTVVDKFAMDKGEKEKLKLQARALDQAGEFKGIDLAFGAIMAEAQSKDPWTSRARPSFLYVMYIMILSAIPFGILHIFAPAAASALTAGMKAWFDAIPTELYVLFGVGYTGYAGMRTIDKAKKLKAESANGASPMAAIMNFFKK